MRVLVTGAAGFLGSHLVDYLLARDCQVVGLDNLLTGSRRNLAHLPAEADFEFVQADVRDPMTIDGAVDGVFHLASPASPLDYQKLPIETLEVGGIGTRNALEFAGAKQARFLLASTSEVYGDPLVHPQPESYWGNANPIGPRSVYDEAKRFAEAMTNAFRHHRGVDTVIVRLFNTYGSRMRPADGRVVSTFAIQALAGEPLTIFGGGRQSRSFCHVSDITRGLVLAFESDLAGPVNLGNPRETTIRELADLILVAAESDSPVADLPLPVDDPRRRCPDISLAETELGWSPSVSLEEGLPMVIEHYRESDAGAGSVRCAAAGVRMTTR